MSDFAKQIDQLIQDQGAVLAKVSVCSSWILVTEWVDGEGNTWLEEHRTSDLPAWRRQGILSYVLETPTDLTEDEEYYD